MTGMMGAKPSLSVPSTMSDQLLRLERNRTSGRDVVKLKSWRAHDFFYKYMICYLITRSL
jgi:hypothetical protein